MVLAPDRERLRVWAGQYPLVPVWQEFLGDRLTALQCYARLHRQGASAFLLESVVGGERWARYSFVGVGHRLMLRGVPTTGGVEFQVVPGGSLAMPTIPAGPGLSPLRACMAAMAAPPVPELPPFFGGLVGVWGHDMIRLSEHLPWPVHRSPAKLPPCELLATDVVLAFDNLAQRMSIIATAMPQCDGGVDAAIAGAFARIDGVRRQLESPGPGDLPPLDLTGTPAQPMGAPSRWGHEGYRAAVGRAQEHILRGDIFQLVLSQAFEQARDGLDPLAVYRMLRATNPAPYMMALRWPSATLVGASPEVLVRVDRTRNVTVRPIAGTRPRGATDDEDAAHERSLLADPKERAEHLMLVDLGRNDVGRVAEAASVAVRESFAVERYSRVMHIVSEIRGQLRPELDAIDALCAAFPAGTLSGAPKIRALELIDELEPVGRGWYGGAVGYFGYDGGADFAIAIRCAVIDDDRIRVQAGAGIVFDSLPEAEDQECHAKASAVWHAVALARAAGGEGAP